MCACSRNRVWQVRHVVIEVFPSDTEAGYGGNVALLSYLYDMGFLCAHATVGPYGALEPLVVWHRYLQRFSRQSSYGC